MFFSIAGDVGERKVSKRETFDQMLDNLSPSGVERLHQSNQKLSSCSSSNQHHQRDGLLTTEPDLPSKSSHYSRSTFEPGSIAVPTSTPQTNENRTETETAIWGFTRRRRHFYPRWKRLNRAAVLRVRHAPTGAPSNQHLLQYVNICSPVCRSVPVQQRTSTIRFRCVQSGGNWMAVPGPHGGCGAEQRLFADFCPLEQLRWIWTDTRATWTVDEPLCLWWRAREWPDERDWAEVPQSTSVCHVNIMNSEIHH